MVIIYISKGNMSAHRRQQKIYLYVQILIHFMGIMR